MPAGGASIVPRPAGASYKPGATCPAEADAGVAQGEATPVVDRACGRALSGETNGSRCGPQAYLRAAGVP
jgi:hypothetical protein